MAINDLSDLSESDLEWLSGKMRYEARRELGEWVQQAAATLETLQRNGQKLENELGDFQEAYVALAQLLAGRKLLELDVLATKLSHLARAREAAGYGDGLLQLSLLLQGHKPPASPVPAPGKG